ncbi:MAG: hypothetical protein KBG29_10285 [Pseudomonadales bacterium]|nr:hypothetical protein [Pseudomonadales bacterium]
MSPPGDIVSLRGCCPSAVPDVPVSPIRDMQVIEISRDIPVARYLSPIRNSIGAGRGMRSDPVFLMRHQRIEKKQHSGVGPVFAK